MSPANLAEYIDPDAGFRVFNPAVESDWLNEEDEHAAYL